MKKETTAHPDGENDRDSEELQLSGFLKEEWGNSYGNVKALSGYRGFLRAIRDFLCDYINYHDTHSRDTLSYGVGGAREIVDLIERLEYPFNFASKGLAELEERYPEFRDVIHGIGNDTQDISGCFFEQELGFYAGVENGGECREGYFDIFDDKIVVTASPDPAETDRLVQIAKRYQSERAEVYIKADVEVSAVIDRIAALLKSDMYLWRRQ